MKVLVVSSTVFPCPPHGYSGLEVLAWHTAQGLASLGHDVILAAPDGSTCPGGQVVHTGPPGGHNEFQAFERYKALLPEAHAVIDHSWQKCSYLLKRDGGLKAPVLGVCHAPVNTMYGSPPPVPRPCIVCISEDQASHWRALHSADARVCYNGIDLNFYKPIEGVKRSPRFLFLARFSSIKGADLAVEACKKAGVGLDLVGDTSITHEPEYFAKVKAQCDGEQIRIVGPALRGECVFWFSRNHVLLHPNQRFREPFGLAPVEAMACGMPVIAWDYGAMRETVGKGESGWLVRSMDELTSVVKQTSQMNFTQDQRNLCRDKAYEFSIENMVKRYEGLCQEAIEGGGW